MNQAAFMHQAVFFYLFAALTVMGALSVIFSRHPVRAVLSLVLTFICGSVLWLLLEVEFLALALVVVYVGAVMVLFLFVVMMIDVDVESRHKTFVSYWPLALLVAILFFVLLAGVLNAHRFGLTTFPAPAPHEAGYSNIQDLGMVLFTQYLYPFEIAGALLLAAMVAAIALTFRGRKPGTKTQIISEQIRVKASERLRMVNMDINQGTVDSCSESGSTVEIIAQTKSGV
jgi:NADH-quinone oxidoreductase subunit J